MLMSLEQEEYFGSPGKVTLMKRSAALWSLLKDNPRYAYYGRLVALSDPPEDTADVLSYLAALQGAAVAYYLPKGTADDLFSQLKQRGLTTDRHEHFWGGETAYRASKDALANYSLPEDLTVSRLDQATPREFVGKVAELCESCDVMPVPGAVMRGQTRRGINLVASDAEGRPVASASSFVLHHSESPHAKDVFWGMLATRPDRRGQKVALVLGAMTIEHMWEKEGARGFMTGVRKDNASSQALCNRLGVTDSSWVYASCVDAQALGSSTVTR
jgi:Acetyltransferase (GNAT) family